MPKTKLTLAINEVLVSGGKAFIPYIMAGDGGLKNLEETLLFLQKEGVTAIEIGIPFSDPVADGPVIQRAGERALANGVTLKGVMKTIASFKKPLDVPLVVMTYLNPIVQYGISKFVEDSTALGISGLIIPDLPFEERALIYNELCNSEIALIPLISLTSSEDRIKKIANGGEGFIYAVTVNGITGARESFKHNLVDHFFTIKKYSPVPVLAGFGISTPEQVQSMGEFCDGIIVGSEIVDRLHQKDYAKVTSLVKASK